MPQAPATLELINVTKSYASADSGLALEVIKGVTLRVEAGQSLAITGPSGSGKSTLLNLMGSLDEPTSGQVLVGGTDLGQLREKQLAAFRNRRIGFVFQSHHLLPQCTALENVLVPTLVSDSPQSRAGAPQRARQLLDRVGLGGRTGHRPGELSGGERQRVAVVRALINQPQLLLADEPTGSLDRDTAMSLGDLLVQLNEEEGVTLILVSHDLELASKMKHIMRLDEGKLANPESTQ